MGDPQGGGQRNSGILPPGSTPYGASYGEWSARYWQWLLGAPEISNPALDETGANAGYGQSGPVWFLAGTFGNSVERTVHVPTGRAMFVALHPWIFGAGVFDCEPTVPGVPCDVPTLRASAAAAAGAATVEASIDGEPVQDIGAYRTQSPGPFSITLPEGAVFGLVPGTYSPQVSDGYWLMLTPMSAGEHLISCHVVNPLAGIDMTATLHVIVGPGGAVAASTGENLSSGARSSTVRRSEKPARRSWGQVKSIYR